MRYEVYFLDCESTVSFDDMDSAIHYARFNDGIVYDTETGNIIARFGNDEM